MRITRILATLALLGGLAVAPPTTPLAAAPRPAAVVAQKIVAAPIVPTDSVIVFTGDSIVASGTLPYPARDGYVPRVSNIICGVFCNTPGHPTIINKTRGGQRLLGGAPTSLANQWPEILASTPTPTTIVVCIGINDMGVKEPGDVVTLAAWAEAYKVLVFSALDLGIRVIPCTMAPVGATFAGRPAVEPMRREANNWLTSYWGADAVADHSSIRLPWDANIADNYYMTADKLHPNAAGTGVLADAFRVVFPRIL